VYRRFTKKGTWEETETLELRFYTIEDATKCIQAQKINFANQAFRTAPKIMAPLKICRVCKTFNQNTGLGRVLVFDLENALETMLAKTTLSQSPG
jgi:hypothetical protein